MRCLVTGCAGFIGSHLTSSLLSDGHTVVGIDGRVAVPEATGASFTGSTVRDTVSVAAE